MTTVRLAVSPGTMFERFTRDAAALLSFDIVSVADPTCLPGCVIAAVKLARDLSDVTVRPISTSADSAMPARRMPDLRICCSFRFRLAGSFRSRAVYERNYLRRGSALHRREGGESMPRWYDAPRGRTGVLPRPGDAALARERLEDLGRVTVGLH